MVRSASALAAPALLLLLVVSVGCEDRKEREQVRETLRRQAEVVRTLRAENRELKADLRRSRLETGGGEPVAPAPVPQPVPSREAEERARALAEQVRELQYELTLARQDRDRTTRPPQDAAKRFLTAVIRSSGDEIAGVVDWDGLARESWHRGGGNPAWERLAESRRRAAAEDTRRRFLAAFTGRGQGRAILMALVERGEKGRFPPSTVRIDLGQAAGGQSRWFLLLAKKGEAWKVVGVVEESIETPTPPSGGTGEGERSGTGEEGSEGR